MDKRIIELAIEALQARRQAIEAEIAQLTGGRQVQAEYAASAGAPTSGRRTRTAAERRAQGVRMKKIWAARKAAATGSAGKPVAKLKGAKPKAGLTAANKARSEKMRAYWAARRSRKSKK